MFEPGFSLHRIILDACRRAGFEPTIGALSSQIEFMIELVGAGMGVAFLPRMIADQRRHRAVGHVLLDEPGVEWSMSMAWRRNGYLSDAAQAWRRLVGEKFGDRRRRRGKRRNVDGVELRPRRRLALRAAATLGRSASRREEACGVSGRELQNLPPGRSRA